MSAQTQSTKPQGKQCNRCGTPLLWNNTNRWFEDAKYPKFQHCCPLPCNKEGCGGTIYFSKLAPLSEETGRPRPLDYPVPQIDPNNSSQMIWVVHVHKNNVPADVPQTAVPPAQAADVKPLDPGQENLVAHIPVHEGNQYVEAMKNPVAQTANKDFEGTIIQTLTNISERLEQLSNTLEVLIPKVNLIAGKIAEGSIKSASDLVDHHLSQ